MMRNMGGPEQSAHMVNPVQPVIHEVFKHQQYDPVYPWIFDWLHQAMIVKKRKDKANIHNAEGKINTAIKQHEVNILCCVL